MPRFFLEELDESDVCITGPDARHIGLSLRMRVGEMLTVCAYGRDYQCRIRSITPEEVHLDVVSSELCAAEPTVALTLYQAVPKADKLEHVIQKATELGAYEIAAFPSSRCVLKLDAASAEKKRERWQKIAASAAAQSGRGRIPQVLVMPSFEDAVRRAAGCELALLPYENEHALSLRRAIGSAQAKTVSIMTGPEGGFSDEEVLLAQRAGLQICTLGPRILRCETAPLCALSAVLFAAGALD